MLKHDTTVIVPDDEPQKPMLAVGSPDHLKQARKKKMNTIFGTVIFNDTSDIVYNSKIRFMKSRIVDEEHSRVFLDTESFGSLKAGQTPDMYLQAPIREDVDSCKPKNLGPKVEKEKPASFVDVLEKLRERSKANKKKPDPLETFLEKVRESKKTQ